MRLLNALRAADCSRRRSVECTADVVFRRAIIKHYDIVCERCTQQVRHYCYYIANAGNDEYFHRRDN